MASPTNNPFDVVKGREQEIGPLFGIITILVLLVAGAIYFWSQEFGKNSKKPATATTTEIIIYRHARAATTTQAAASSTGNAELDAIQNNLDNHTQNVDNLNF